MLTAERDLHLLPRDILLRDSFTPAERMLFVMLLALAGITVWIASPRSMVALGSLVIAGSLFPVVLSSHIHHHPFDVGRLWQRFLLLNSPIIVLFVCFALGVFNPYLSSIVIDEQTILVIDAGLSWLPSTTKATTTWLPAFAFASIYITTSLVFLVPKSEAFFTRLAPWLVGQACVLCLFGFYLSAFRFDGVPLFGTTGRSDFFASFTYDGHWSAYALLWGSFAFAYGILSARRHPEEDLLRSNTLWYFAAGLLLGFSAMRVEAGWSAFIQLCVLAFMLGACLYQFSGKRVHLSHSILTRTVTASLLVAALAAAMSKIASAQRSDPAAVALRDSSWAMFLDRPLLGWGFDAFAYLFPFYASDQLLGVRYVRAQSDIVQLLAELGLVGATLITLTLAILVGRFLRSKYRLRLTLISLVACFAIPVVALFDSPLMSPAVVYSAGLIFFMSLRWADLTRFKADEVDHRPTLVTPESERKVPFYTGTHPDKVK